MLQRCISRSWAGLPPFPPFCCRSTHNRGEVLDWSFQAADLNTSHHSVTLYSVHNLFIKHTFSSVNTNSLHYSIHFLHDGNVNWCHQTDVTVALQPEVHQMFLDLVFLCLWPWFCVAVFAFCFLLSAQTHKSYFITVFHHFASAFFRPTNKLNYIPFKVLICESQART